MFIYVNGDSNAAGFELSHPSLPSYPGHIPPGLINRSNFLSLDTIFAKAANWLESELFKKEKAEFGEAKIRQRDLELAWPSKIKEYLGCEVEANAIAGSSTVRVAYTVQHDLLRLKKENKVPDKVILQLTDWVRTGTFSLDDKFDICQNINSSPNNEERRKNFFNSWINIETEQDMILRYLHHWVMIKHTVKVITGRDPIFVDSTYELHIADLLEKATHPRQLELIDELGWKNFDRTLSMSYYHDTEADYLHPGLHLSEPVHEKFAKAIAEKIQNGLL
jgi:hypothetical protein